MASSEITDNSRVSMSRALDIQVAAHKHRETVRKDRIALIHKVIYGLGAFVNLNATGFDAALEGHETENTLFLMRFFDAVVPIAKAVLAMWTVASFPITEERVLEIRSELEQRRGAATLVPA